MFYVLGHDDQGRLVSMTSRAFPDVEAARDYAATCNQGWTPFVVQAVPNEEPAFILAEVKREEEPESRL